ncbi:MAG: hypothetical protein Q7J63_08795 [Rhodonellum sp.]|nr:hypothetical protein [Rhodonellum sp.]
MKVITTSIQTLPAKLAGGLFISLTIASSCSDPSNIGLDLDPNNNQIGVFFTEIPLSASMVLLDSFNTTNQGSFVVGGETSAFFGKTEGIGFSRLAINVTAPLPRQEAILDSVKFNFQVESATGKNFSTPKSLKVHLLTEGIQDTSYYSFDRLEFDPVSIAENSFNFSARKDTMVSTKVKDEFAAFLFQEMKKGDAFKDIFSFRRLIQGIAITGNPEQEASISLRVGNTTGISVFYHYQGDTVPTVYPISTAQSRHFNYVKNDRQGTPTEIITQSGKAYDTGEKVGSKSGVGLVLKIDTSPIDAFLDSITNVTFNDISFEIGPLESASADNLPPTFMVMNFTNETNRVLTRFDGEPLSIQADGQAQQGVDPNGNIVPAVLAPALLAYFSESKVYNQRITSYINSVYRSNLQRNDWILYPNSPGTAGDDFKKSFKEFVVNKNNIKLKIYYSKIRAL